MSKKSGPAIFMYAVIAGCILVSSGCFALYYSHTVQNGAVLWSGVATFMVMYHFWLRIIMGNVTKLFRINCNSRWFKEKTFEKGLYKFLKVKKWKNKALTYNPELFSLKDFSLEEIVRTMTKAETDHWINEIISLTSILFAFVWGELWVFLLTAVAAMVFDAQFIIIQRYNRPRLLRTIERRNRKIEIGCNL